MTPLTYFIQFVLWFGVVTLALWLTACLVFVVLWGVVRWNDRERANNITGSR